MDNNDHEKDLPAVNSSEDMPAPTGPAVKKPFIEPEISVPVNVLEATTFLQTVDSGTSN